MTGERPPAPPAPPARHVPPVPLESRLGYLLKHAQQRLARASAAALAPFGIDGHELAVLAVLAAEYPLSQVEVAGRLASTAPRWSRSSTAWRTRGWSSGAAVLRTGARTSSS